MPTLPSQLPLMSARNLLRLGEHAAGLLAARLSATWDETFIARLVESQAGRSALRDKTEREMRRFFDMTGIDQDPAQAAAEHVRAFRELQWIRCRTLAHPELVNLKTSLEGKHNINDALREGHGAILWGMQFCGFLAAKIALYRGGVELVHLSSAAHGAGRPITRVGLRTLARIYRDQEDRYLAERLIIPHSGAMGYLRTLKQRLQQNRCLWILGEGDAGRGKVAVPFFNGQRQFATGAPALSWSTGAALLPTVTVRKGRYHYQVMVDEPLRSSADNKQDFVRSLVAQYARRLEQRVREYPEYWNWHGNMTAMLSHHLESGAS